MKKHAIKIFLLLACSGLLLSCAQSKIGKEPVISEYTGCYSYGFESGVFSQAPVQAESELWYVTSAPDQFWDAVERLAKPGNDAEVYARVRAILGLERKEGYGPMGMARREMHITEVLDLRANAASDGPCFPAPQRLTQFVGVD
ncbi:MAG: hypothetical protein QM808_15195 [Steroidobacteraceae bacterium]